MIASTMASLMLAALVGGLTAKPPTWLSLVPLRLKAYDVPKDCKDLPTGHITESTHLECIKSQIQSSSDKITQIKCLNTLGAKPIEHGRCYIQATLSNAHGSPRSWMAKTCNESVKNDLKRVSLEGHTWGLYYTARAEATAQLKLVSMDYGQCATTTTNVFSITPSDVMSTQYALPPYAHAQCRDNTQGTDYFNSGTWLFVLEWDLECA